MERQPEASELTILEHFENAKFNLIEEASGNSHNDTKFNLDESIDHLTKALNHPHSNMLHLKEELDAYIDTLKLTREFFTTPSGKEDLYADIKYVLDKLDDLQVRKQRELQIQAAHNISRVDKFEDLEEALRVLDARKRRRRKTKKRKKRKSRRIKRRKTRHKKHRK